MCTTSIDNCYMSASDIIYDNSLEGGAVVPVVCAVEGSASVEPEVLNICMLTVHFKYKVELNLDYFHFCTDSHFFTLSCIICIHERA